MNRTDFYEVVRAKIGRLSQAQVDGMEELLDCFDRRPWPLLVDGAYALATVKIECGDKWRPITEWGEPSYFEKYEPGTRRGRSLGNTKAGDGWLYRGRGYCMVTGRSNYGRMGDALELPLLDHPELLLDPWNSYRAMQYGMLTGLFTGQKLHTFTDRPMPDYFGARRVINGEDRASEIAGYARVYETGLMAAGYLEVMV